jgi:serralysin
MAVSDIVFLQDLTGSFSDDLNQQQVLLPAVVNRITNPILAPIFGSDLRLGLASFMDKPIADLGGPFDYVYRPELALTNNSAAVKSVIQGWTTGDGGDFPEAQLDALLYTALDSGSGLGYRDGSFRVVILSTDDRYHVAGDRAKFSSDTVPNNGDAVIGFNEDYATIPQVRTALESQNIVPIFLATNDQLSTYQALVSQLGRGGVLSLDSRSENVADAIKEGIAKARGVITDQGKSGDDFLSPPPSSGNKVVFAGNGNDTINLRAVNGNHFIDGGAGSDILFDGSGADKMDGGSDDDILVGSNGDDVLLGSSGNDNLTGGGGNDFLQGDSGNDLLTGGTGADKFVFATGGFFVRDELGLDTINDFNSSQGDKIQLSKATFKTLSNSVFPSALNAADFAIVTSDDLVQTNRAAIVYNSSNGNLFYNPNGVNIGFDLIEIDPNPTIRGESGERIVEGGQFATLTRGTDVVLTTASFEVIV